MYLNIRQFANLQPKIVKDDYIQIFEKKNLETEGKLCVNATTGNDLCGACLGKQSRLVTYSKEECYSYKRCKKHVVYFIIPQYSM